LDSTDYISLNNLGLCHQRMKNYAEAEKYFNKSLETVPDDTLCILIYTNLIWNYALNKNPYLALNTVHKMFNSKHIKIYFLHEFRIRWIFDNLGINLIILKWMSFILMGIFTYLVYKYFRSD